MPKPLEKVRISTAAKIFAAVLSAATALVTIFTFARSYGLIGPPAPAALTVGSLGVSWVGISPVADTARSLGDTLRLAATVTDDNGTALIGASIRWASDEPSVAEAIGGGRVVAKRPGVTTIIATVGDRIARARVTVLQKVASVRVNADAGLTLGEDERRRVVARAYDARGNEVPGRRAVWRSSDTTIAAVDSAGVAAGRAQGNAELAVEIDGVSAAATVNVVPHPGSIELVAGGGQRAIAGAALAQPVVVRLLSTRGKPIADAAVRFRTSDGRGGAEPAIVVTDSRGIARTTWTLGALPGRQRLLASNERLDSAAAIVAEAEPAAANTRLVSRRDALAGRAGEPLADTAVVAVTDSAGRALADVPVTWSAEQQGHVTPLAERTDSLGEARATWTLGPTSGVQHVRVRVGSGRSVPALAIGALASPGVAAKLVVAAGSAQKGRVGEALPKRIVLRVVDAAGNAVPGITLALSASAGELADSTPTTDSTGQVRVAWKMPRVAGALKLTARAAGVKPAVELTATASPAPAANVTFAEPRSAPVAGKPLGKSVDVTVTDVYGNPIAGAVVAFKARSGVAAPAKVATDAAGVARTHWTLGTKPGEQTLTAAVNGGESVRGSLTVTVGATAVREARPLRRAERSTRGSAHR